MTRKCELSTVLDFQGMRIHQEGDLMLIMEMIELFIIAQAMQRNQNPLAVINEMYLKIESRLNGGLKA